MELYVEVVVDQAVPTVLTYSVKAEHGNVVVGARVVVTVTTRRCVGVIIAVHHVKPDYKTIAIKEIIDTEGNSLLTAHDTELWQWVAQYYMVPLTVVYKTVMPAVFRSNSLVRKSQTYVEAADATIDMAQALESLKRAPKQEEMLVRFLDFSESQGRVSRSALVDGDESRALALSQLCRKQILCQREYPMVVPKVKRLPPVESDELFETINRELQSKTVLFFERSHVDKQLLLRSMIERQVQAKKQTLILMPDNYSAESVYEELRAELGEGVVGYFPSMSQLSRSQAFLSSIDEAEVVVGARGAVFLPMRRLGLVVVDQEQDSGYKNRDSAPRMNIRDVAMVKAAKCGAKVLLMSEAPSVESYYNATRGLWSMVVNDVRQGRVINFTVLERGKEMLSSYLRRRVKEAIERGEQALIFQNRRGFSMWVECAVCMDIPTCENCNVSLTYHKTDNSLRCHYCGFHHPFTPVCGKCGSGTIEFQGRGTERIEESLQSIFAEARILRMDYDSTRGKGAFERIAAAVTTSSCDIIVGTQLVVRGLDFRNISLVGIVNADNLLSQADFRTSERAFILLTQLSNRIGTTDGEVVIQTTKRLNEVIKSVEEREYKFFYENELAQRKQMNYPPFVRMINITFSHGDRSEVMKAADFFRKIMRPIFGNRLSPPFEPSVERQMNNYLLQCYIRVEREKSIVRAKELILASLQSMSKVFPSVGISLDVDPL